MNYTIPSNLLGSQNSKTSKGEKYGWITYIMYLAPHKQNSSGKNLCPKASKGCAKACLYNSGNARFSHVQKGRMNKTDYFLSDMKSYMAQLDNEIAAITKKHHKKGETNLAIRLNGTSDFPFENIKVREDKNIFELHPEIQFYDYTKDSKRILNNTVSNYHITFSRSESNHEEVLEVLKAGFNVAVVFDELPEIYLGKRVVNGDQSDLRFLDDQNVIVGLKFKKNSVKGGGENNIEAFTSGFAVKRAEIKSALSPEMEMLIAA